ncbi:uncharacterized protein [Dermacentor albipictus]|uniref:uncharacterized protein n=1 Tax=Dermacentor albipictus TaxID=60249 RepID=UPI0038FC99C9
MTSLTDKWIASPLGLKGPPAPAFFSGHGNPVVTMTPNVPLFVQIAAGCLVLASASGTTISTSDGCCWRGAELGTPVTVRFDNAFDTFSTPPTISAAAHAHDAHGEPRKATMTSLTDKWIASPLGLKGPPAPAFFSGHGNPVVTMTPNVPLFVQVGGRKTGFSSNSLCLIVLPCPQIVLDCLNDVFSMASLLLILSGDVEENPGPPMEDMVKEMLQNQKEILSKISEIQQKQVSSELNITQIQSKLVDIEKKLQSMDQIENRLTKVESCVETLDVHVAALRRQTEDLDNRSRRNNLIIRGVEEEDSETDEILMKKVNEEIIGGILKQKLNSIERIHRLGKKIPGQIRPIIFRVTDFRDKVRILSNCRKLRGTQFSINEDFSKRVVEIRKKLWKSSEEERMKGAKVKLFFDKLRVDKTMYAWNDVTNERSKWHASPDKTTA